METILLGILNFAGGTNFQIVGKILALVFIIFWIVVLDWVWLDAGERTSNKKARICYLLLVLLFNILGWIIYLIIRPSQTIEQIYWADLERRYLKYETSELGDCPECGTQLYPGYTFCPQCGLELKNKCRNCDIYIEKNYEFCPFCGTKVGKGVEEEVAPSREIMEQQIQASKEEAAKAVESDQTRYSTKKQVITVRIGSALINAYEKLANRSKNKVSSKNKQQPKKNKKQKKSKKH